MPSRCTSLMLILGLSAGAALGCQTPGGWPPAPPLQTPAEADPGPLPLSVKAVALPAGQWRATFGYKPLGRPVRVSLAGTFNGWNPSATPLEGPDNNGHWTVTVDLAGGEHLYKFVVDGGRWYHDPLNPEHVDDLRGGRNSVLRLGSLGHLAESPRAVGDGRIEGVAVVHDPGRPLYRQRLAPDRMLVRLQTLTDDVESVAVVVRDGGRSELAPAECGPVFTLWEGVAHLPPAETGNGEFAYTFALKDGPLTASSPHTYGVPVSPEQIFHTPDWAKHAIWYQIFPDRFRNGEPRNDRDPARPWTSEWFTPSPWEGQDGQTFYKHFVFDRQYGGDLQGLIEKLPYLKELGVNALYLNPVFKAESNHKYNAETYLHIDDHFGVKGDYDRIKNQEDHNDPKTWVWTETDKLFLEFLRQAHAQGFKVIIDGVFNHVGTAHPAFQDVKQNGQKSKYADWFHVTSWEPFKYEGWFGHDALPVFRKSADGLASERVKQHIFNVTRRWMDPNGDGDPSDGIDGWRLDVPNEIPAPFWVEWREVVKSVNPDAYITGEIWDQADTWLDGKHFDAVMNYEFTKGAVAWMFNKKLRITPSELDRRFRELRLAYPLEATRVLQNLMDSHDTDRVASMALNPDRKFDDGNRIQDNGPKYNNAKPGPGEYEKVRLAALLQMTYVGAPMVYYGDEVGMWGADDPTCRKPMLWPDLEPYEQPKENFVMKDHLAFYRRVIALRSAHPALRTGGFQTLLTDDDQDVWAFLRKNDDEQLIVALNASKKEAEVIIPLPLQAPQRWQAVFNLEGDVAAEGHKLRLRVPAHSGIVLHADTPR